MVYFMVYLVDNFFYLWNTDKTMFCIDAAAGDKVKNSNSPISF